MACEPPECSCGEPWEHGHEAVCVNTRIKALKARGPDAVPADAARPCDDCGDGTLTPRVERPGDLHFDADGGAMVTLVCTNSSCRIESSHSWCWDNT